MTASPQPTDGREALRQLFTRELSNERYEFVTSAPFPGWSYMKSPGESDIGMHQSFISFLATCVELERWPTSCVEAPVPQPTSPSVDGLRAQAFELSCEDQYRLAVFIAANVGYVLTGEPDEIARIVSEKIIKDIIRPGWGPEERTCYDIADQIRAAIPETVNILHASPPSQPDTGLREALERIINVPIGYQAASQMVDIARKALAALPPDAGSQKSVCIEHDGFEGTIIGYYTTREGKRGVVLQQTGTKVVHVYGEKWIKP